MSRASVACFGAAVAVAAAGCGDDTTETTGGADILVKPLWNSPPSTTLSPQHLGHNTVWSRGGLGLWDEDKHEVSSEVESLVAGVKPGILRFPGGTRAMRYHFAEAIGAYDERTPQCDPFVGNTDPTTWGPDEFLRFAEDLGAAVSLVAPWVDGTPQEAAAFVAYANADPNSHVDLGIDENGKNWGTAGEWGARRVANGHPAPYAIRMLEIGNEQYISTPIGPATSCGRPSRFKQSERWVGGTPIPTTAVDYAKQVERTGNLVHQVDPSVLVGASTLSHYDPAEDSRDAVGDVDKETKTDDPWNKRLLNQASAGFDSFVLHPYDLAEDDDRLLLADRLEAAVHELKELAPGKRIAVTEFGFLFGGGTLRNALVTADIVRVAAESGLDTAMRHILIEDDASGLFADSAAILGANHRKMPGYLAMQLLANAMQPSVVAAKGTSEVTALVTRNDDGTALAVSLVDRRITQGSALVVGVVLPHGSWSAKTWTLSGPNLDADDSAVEVREGTATAGDRLTLTVPPHSLVIALLTPRS